ncbi:hypothetical protein [Cyclobacterium sp.]|uniref:hypothetical protein n=1 Tax=Cyclobacterium sp. TaxID=1966343 RepID=UPI00198E0856|nr:hypothetical protein [Cyclobacterium sp.]MBD3627597.1 hypothetical protein [Cyclobacterium sp.]
MEAKPAKIRLRDALRAMDRLDHKGNPTPFTITFYTADRKRDTGGKKMTIEGGILSKHAKGLPMHMRRVDGFGGSKAPRHYQNATRNVSSPDGSITTVHIRLITHFNGLRIIW